MYVDDSWPAGFEIYNWYWRDFRLIKLSDDQDGGYVDAVTVGGRGAHLER